MRPLEFLLEARYRLEKVVHPLRGVSVEVTRRCNLACRHCYVQAGPNCQDELALPQLQAFAAKLKQDFGPGMNIRITGGEPLIRTDILEIIDGFRNQGFIVTMSSNGVLITEKLASELAKRLDGMSISLDGLTEAHNYLRGAPVFDTTLEAVRLLKRAGMRRIGIKTTVYRKNLTELSAIHAIVLSLGVDQWHVFAMEPHGRGALHPDLLLSQQEYEQMRTTLQRLASAPTIPILFGEENVLTAAPCTSCPKRHCAAGVTQAAILHDGSIFSCICADRSRPAEGNIARDDFTQVWETGFGRNREETYRQCGHHAYV